MMVSIPPGMLMLGIGAFLHSLPITILNGLPYGSVSTNLQSSRHASSFDLFIAFVNFSFAFFSDSFSTALASVPSRLRLR